MWLWPAASHGITLSAGQGRSANLKVPLRVAALVAPIILSVLVVSPLPAIEGPLLFAIWARLASRSQKRKLAVTGQEALLVFVDRTVAGLRSGSSLAAAFRSAIQEAQLPSENELVCAVEAAAAGAPLGVSLGAAGAATVDPDVRLLATTVEMISVSGGSAGPAMERAGDTLRARLASEAESRTQAQQALASASVLALLPAIFAGLGAAVEPDLALFYLRNPIGVACVVGATLLTWAGWEWMERLVWK